MAANVEDLRQVDVADVYKGDRLAGTLERSGSEVVFRYGADYVADPRTPQVAWAVPKDGPPARGTGDSVPPFFAGLLPEGARLSALVAGTKTSADDHLTLLLAVGNDTIGDVRVVPQGMAPVEPAVAFDDRDMSTLDLAALFVGVTGQDTLEYDTAALPGVQPKVSAAMVSAPLRAATGPAILKLNPDRYPQLVENERFFLSMARDCGIEVPDHRLVHDGHGRAGLLVSRFDREVAGDVVRLAQEDACQVLDVYPGSKYRLKTEDVVARLGHAVLAGGGSRPLAVLRLFELVAFSYLIGNGDLHGKNFSIGRRRGGRWDVTPAYDLICTQPYLSWRDPMALTLYGRANRLTRSHLLAAGERLGLTERALTARLDRMCDKAGSWVDRVEEIGLEAKATRQLEGMLVARLAELAKAEVRGAPFPDADAAPTS